MKLSGTGNKIELVFLVVLVFKMQPDVVSGIGTRSSRVFGKPARRLAWHHKAGGARPLGTCAAARSTRVFTARHYQGWNRMEVSWRDDVDRTIANAV